MDEPLSSRWSSSSIPRQLYEFHEVYKVKLKFKVLNALVLCSTNKINKYIN